MKNLYRRITYRLIDDLQVFKFHRELLTDCFETDGHRVDTLKRCLWKCPGDKGYAGLPDRDFCTECPFAVEFRDFLDHDHAALAMYFERRALAPLTSFNFVNRSAYIYVQRHFLFGDKEHCRRQARWFITKLKGKPLGSAGKKEQIAERYVNLEGTKPLWQVVSEGEEYHLPDHDMM